jgi:DNA-binding MarR family transcriptional regulator
MADINPAGDSGDVGAHVAHGEPPAPAAAAGQSQAAPDDTLIGLVELFFFAYRDFTGEADEALAELGFGRAHHRVLHFVSRNPGIRVADLLDILKITKQSLARVLKQLVDEGYIDQMAGTSDRRERRLYVTFRGESLARELMALQAKRVASALERAGEKSYHSAESFLYAMISPGERQRVQQLLRGSNPVSSE